MRANTTIHWRAYPALGLAGCLAAGIAAAGAASLPFWSWLGVGGLALLMTVGAAFYARRRLVTPAPLLRTVAAGLGVFALGGALATSATLLPPHHLAHFAPDLSASVLPVVVEGRVASEPEQRPHATRFVLTARRLLLLQDTLATTGRVQVTLAQSPWAPHRTYPRVQEGDVVQLEGRLRPPPLKRNPADFDYGVYLKQRGIYATLAVYDSAAVAVLGQERTGASRLAVPARAYVRRHLDRLLPSPVSRAVLTALILGDRSRIDAGTRERFAETGLMHLLAVSGLHVLLVGMVLYGLLRPFLVRLGFGWFRMEITRAVATLAVLLFYVLLTGARPSVVRAVVMAALFIGATLLQRSSHPLNTLGVAALALLLARPAYLFDVGFQLSFGAVAAIVSLNPVFQDALPPRWRESALFGKAFNMITVSLAATLGTLPVLLVHFGKAPFGGLLLNLAAIPLTALALAAGIVALLLAGWLGGIAEVFGAAADVLARALLWTAEAGAEWFAWAALSTYVENVWIILAMISALVMLTQWPRPRLRWRLGALALLFANLAVWISVVNGAHRPALEVVFFDVGQGDAALVSLPNGKHLLIDTGPRAGASDQASWTILPHLARHGIRRLDAVIVTHPHSDHLGGLPTLLRSLPVGEVVHSGLACPSALCEETQHVLDSLALPHHRARASEALLLDPSVRLHILWPLDEGSVDNLNNASVVLRLTYGTATFLFTGDAEKEVEERLLASFGPALQSDVVKVGHHGSSTSSIPPFVEKVLPDSLSPSTAVVSVGANNPYGLPSGEVLARWHARGADVLTTAAERAVWLRTDGRTIERVDWR